MGLISNWIEWHIAGLGPMIWHWGIGIGVIIILGLLEVFTELLAGIPRIGPWLVQVLTPLRKDMLWVMAIIAVSLMVYQWGVKDEARRCLAQGHVVEVQVDRAVSDARKPAPNGVRNDKWNSKDN